MADMRWTALNLAADEIRNLTFDQMEPRPRSSLRKAVAEDETMRRIRAEVRRLCDLVGYTPTITSRVEEEDMVP